MTVFHLRKTISGRPGNLRSSKRYRNPRACRYRRTVSSGSVSRARMRDIMRDLVSALTISTMRRSEPALPCDCATSLLTVWSQTRVPHKRQAGPPNRNCKANLAPLSAAPAIP